MSEWITDSYKIIVRKKVWGLVWRAFGVRYDAGHGQYMLTHVPTGRHLTASETEEELKRIAEKLWKVPLDWGSDDLQYFTQAYREHEAEVKKALGRR